MPEKLYNLARMTSPTTGTGATIILGLAAAGFNTFAQAGVVDGERITYAIADPSSNPTSTELAWGIYSASGTTVSRVTISSNNANSPINLSGAQQVFITPSAQDLWPILTAAHSQAGGL